MLTDTTQAVVNSYAYDTFGTVLNQQETVPRLFKFVGQYGVMAEPNGLYCMRARYYDPSVGRFISEDPLGFGGGDVNLYAYVSNNPINRVDRFGLQGVALNPFGPPLPIPVNPIKLSPRQWEAMRDFFKPLLPPWMWNEDTKDTAGDDEVPSPCEEGKEHSPDRRALNDLINDATRGGRQPLSDSDADTVLDWADELGVGGARDDRATDHWDGGPHIHVPGSGIRHIPTW